MGEERKAQSVKLTRKTKGISLSILFSSVSIALCVLRFTLSFAETKQYIRVSIVREAKSFSLVIKGKYEIRDSMSRQVISQGENLKTTVTVYKNGILLGPVTSSSEDIFIKTWEPDEIVINGRTFRGDVHCLKKNKLLSLINYLELEDYIKGVLYHEASHYWPDEILKAQAIVCRTFALYQVQESKKSRYDVTSDIYSQMYGGSTSERYRTNRAVEETKGAVLTYRGKIFPAYYHATCAGHTEDASLLWNIDLPVLKGVPCPFCKESPHYHWHADLPIKEAQWALKKAGKALKSFKAIEVVGKDASGRITELRISGAEEGTVISAKDFRNILGPNTVKSTNFEARVEDGDLVFEGLGWGHGVGMCQWGGYFLAKEGRTFQEIIQYYYPGASIEQYKQ